MQPGCGNECIYILVAGLFLAWYICYISILLYQNTVLSKRLQLQSAAHKSGLIMTVYLANKLQFHYVVHSASGATTKRVGDGTA